MASSNLTAARLRELLAYSPETGEFRWIRGRPGVGAGSVAGSRAKNGYIYIGIEGGKYLAHRLAWLYVYGSWPSCDIDHINWVCTDNRLANLRDVERHINNQNRSRVRSDNKASRETGVSWHIHSRKWRSRIWLQGKEYRLGLFDTIDEAKACYLAAKRRMHAGCVI